jgi:hypothetical protein
VSYHFQATPPTAPKEAAKIKAAHGKLLSCGVENRGASLSNCPGAFRDRRGRQLQHCEALTTAPASTVETNGEQKHNTNSNAQHGKNRYHCIRHLLRNDELLFRPTPDEKKGRGQQ